MNNQNWLEIVTRPGKPEQAMIMNPLPSGPYCIVPQGLENEFREMAKDHHEVGFFQMSVNMLKEMAVSDEFQLKFGYSVFIVRNGNAIKVGFYYDTSD